jgi:hypothetical protein
MDKALKEFKVPGVVWIFLLMFIAIGVAWYTPEYAVFVPLIFGLISYLINQFAPEDSRLKELLKIIQDLVPLQPAVRRDIRVIDSPEGSPRSSAPLPLATLHTVEEAEEIAQGSRAGKILWG